MCWAKNVYVARHERSQQFAGSGRGFVTAGMKSAFKKDL